MDYLILDTNIYINLCLKRADNVTAPCVVCLSELLSANKIKLVLPEIVKIEFLRNIGPEFEKSKKFLKSVINEINKIVLPHDITDKLRLETNEKLQEILSNFKNIDVNEQIKPVLDILDHKNTVLIPNSDDLVIKTFKRVIEKKAPAHNENKKSEADCLIVEAILSYFQKVENYEKVFFITDNKSDFANPKKISELHPHLQPSFNELGIAYDPHLAKILKEEFGQNIDDEDLKFEEEIIQRPRYRDIPLHGVLDSTLSPFLSSSSEIGEGASCVVVRSTGPPFYTDPSGGSNFIDGEGM